MSKKIVFSGIQPSGNLHIGNYLGAIKQWVEMQDDYQCIFCVVDLHAITVKQKPEELKKNILEMVKVYIASGIDPKKSFIFQQSDIAEHSELAWILNNIISVGELKRMRQFNDKTGIRSVDDYKSDYSIVLKKLADKYLKNLDEEVRKTINYKYSLDKFNEAKKTDTQIVKFLNNLVNDAIKISSDNTKNYFSLSWNELNKFIDEENLKFNKSTVGLFDYPVLMAADILLYNTDIVPVGEDQKQHVELARDIAKRFNHQFGETFKIPDVKIKKEGARIMGLDDPIKKMSKSASSPFNFIALTDDPEKAVKKIMKAVTDTEGIVKYDKEKKPGISNLLNIYSLLSGKSIAELEKNYSGKGYGDFKKDLAEVVKNFLNDFQNKYNKISDKDALNILEEGFKKLKPMAEETHKRVKKIIGLK